MWLMHYLSMTVPVDVSGNRFGALLTEQRLRMEICDDNSHAWTGVLQGFREAPAPAKSMIV